MSEVNIPRCQHIKVNGLQCGSPALRRKKFCFFHQRWRNYPKTHRSKWSDPVSWFDLPPLEDANSVQEAVMQVTRLVLCGRMDNKTAGVLLYALQIANTNLKHLTFEPDWKQVVVNPGAVRYSPLQLTSESGDPEQDLNKENEMLNRRLFQGPDNSEQKPGEDARPCATAAAALAADLHSRHPLPTSPEDWEALKHQDFTAWLMAFTSLTMPPEQASELRADMREHPEKYGRNPDPDFQLLTALGRVMEAEDEAKQRP